jgi:hypothetical protein
VAVLVLSSAGCNNGKLYGRIVGFVVNGTTGQRLNAFPNSGDLANLGNDANATNEVFALIQGKFVRAQPCGQGDANSKNQIAADGCFKFENVPTNTDIPVFAQFDGFDRFQGKTRITTNAVTTTDLTDADPQKIANIMLWPKGFQQDYQVLVTAHQVVVPNATVACQANPTSNQFETAGSDFVTPEATTLETVRATTAADGTAVLPGASLVNGANYSCSVWLPSSFDGTEVQTSGFGFQAGVSQPLLVFNLSVSGPGSPLFAIRSNNDDTNALLGLNASMVITLNQPAQIVPLSDDCQTAVLTNPLSAGNLTPGALPADAPGNGASEQVSANVSTDGLTLTVTNKPYVTAPDPRDIGTFIVFHGIFLRPRDPALQRVVVDIGGSSGNGSSGCTLGTQWGNSPMQNFRTGAAQTNRINIF